MMIAIDGSSSCWAALRWAAWYELGQWHSSTPERSPDRLRSGQSMSRTEMGDRPDHRDGHAEQAGERVEHERGLVVEPVERGHGTVQA